MTEPRDYDDLEFIEFSIEPDGSGGAFPIEDAGDLSGVASGDAPRIDRDTPPVEVPDLSGAIMSRLGYVRAPAAAVRRRRLGLAVRRASLCAAGVVMIAVAFAAYSRGPQARRPAEVTLPAAIGADVDRHRTSLEQTIRTIRMLAPQREDADGADGADGAREDIDEAVDRSAIGPVRWI